MPRTLARFAVAAVSPAGYGSGVRIRVLFFAAVLSAGSAAGQAPDEARLAELREAISKEVDVRAQASAEAADWEARKAEMAALLELHRRELELLDEELAEAGQSAGGHDERRSEAEAAVAKLRGVRSAAAEVVAANRDRALALAARFPRPLREAGEADRLQLESWRAGDEPRGGLQAILALATAAEQFNRRVTRSVEERDGREVEVIYLGLALAYYADRHGNAGIGRPSTDGWSWESRPEIHGVVSGALAQLDKRRPPEVVELPVRIDGKEAP